MNRFTSEVEDEQATLPLLEHEYSMAGRTPNKACESDGSRFGLSASNSNFGTMPSSNLFKSRDADQCFASFGLLNERARPQSTQSSSAFGSQPFGAQPSSTQSSSAFCSQPSNPQVYRWTSESSSRFGSTNSSETDDKKSNDVPWCYKRLD